MERVRRLVPREVIRQDTDAMAEIYRNLGAPVAEQLVTRAFGELALTMAGLAERVMHHDLVELSRHLRRLKRLAEEIGLLSLGAVAGDAADCLDQADATAFAAVWARLLRVAGVSLAHDPGIADLSN